MSKSHLNRIFSSTGAMKKIIPAAGMQKLGIKTAKDAVDFFHGKTVTQANEAMRSAGVHHSVRSTVGSHLSGQANQVKETGFKIESDKARYEQMVSAVVKGGKLDRGLFNVYKRKIAPSGQGLYEKRVREEVSKIQRNLKRDQAIRGAERVAELGGGKNEPQASPFAGMDVHGATNVSVYGSGSKPAASAADMKRGGGRPDGQDKAKSGGSDNPLLKLI